MSKDLRGMGGSIVAIATPFHEAGLDVESLGQLCERQIARGTTAIVVCGSTGEASSLNPAEHALAVRAVVQAAGGRVPVVAGCTAAATWASVALAETAARAGADGLLCAAPPYVKPTQDGVFAHMRAINQACDLPIILYDVPSRSGIAIADATVAGLFQQGIIVAIKDATADLARPPRLRAVCGASLVQLSGDDATAAAHRGMGGHGCISVTANVTPRMCAMLHHAWDSQDRTAFERLRDRLDPLHAALFSETNPVPLKFALAHLGLCSGRVRLPLTRAQPHARQRVRQALSLAMADEETIAAPRRYALAS